MVESKLNANNRQDLSGAPAALPKSLTLALLTGTAVLAGWLQRISQKLSCCKLRFKGVLVLQADAYRGAERLGQFQLLADWRLQDMQQWVLVSHQKEGDTAALERYRKQVPP